MASIGTICATEGALSGQFSVSVDKKVVFSQGNLQYQASTNTWRFAENQYDAIGYDNSNISETYDGWIDLFGWGTGSNPTLNTYNASDFNTFVDWGTNPISNGGNIQNIWRTLTRSEWEYLIGSRDNAENLYGKATINGTHGLVILPDNWVENEKFKPQHYDWTSNEYTTESWQILEDLGAVFLPAAGDRSGSVCFYNEVGSYWFSDAENETHGSDVSFSEYSIECDGNHNDDGQSVRLVKDFTGDETPKKIDCNIRYVDKDANLVSSEQFTFNVPAAPIIKGFTFLKWQVVAGDFEDGITIQAVYTANEPASTPAVYTNPSNPAQKLLRNGNVYILTDNSRTYTVDGRLVR